MTERTPLKAAIIGGGMIGTVHAAALRSTGIALRGVLASSEVSSKETAERFDVPVAYPDLDALLSDDSVDVVHVCTPNQLHVAQAVATLSAGKHVICEKPMATSRSDAEQLVRASTDARREVLIPFVYRFHPVVREIRARVQADDFGAWQLFHGSYLQDWLLNPNVSNWRVDPAVGGRSRAFADIGTHWFDLVEWVSGVRFADVFASFRTTHTDRPAQATKTFASDDAKWGERARVGTEDVSCVLARTSSGIPASVTISQVSAGRKNRLWFELDGADGSAVFDQEHPESAWFGSVDGWYEFLRDSSSGSREQRRLSSLPAGHAQGHIDLFRAFLNDAYARIGGDQTVEGIPDVRDGLRSSILVDAVIRSAESERWVPIALGESAHH